MTPQGNGVRKALAALMLVMGLAACAQGVPPQTRAEALVNNARWTVETFKQRDEAPNKHFRQELATARGIVVLPGTVKGGFVIGAEYGDGVLVARQPDGSWGYPAFYSLGAGSIGLQAGGRAADVVLVLRNDGAVRSVVKHQGKLGADLEVTVGTAGAGVGAATTANVGADVIAFSHGTGLFGGGSVDGSVLARRTDLNEAYYGAGATPESIVLENRHANPQADSLRQALVIE